MALLVKHCTVSRVSAPPSSWPGHPEEMQVLKPPWDLRFCISDQCLRDAVLLTQEPHFEEQSL